MVTHTHTHTLSLSLSLFLSTPFTQLQSSQVPQTGPSPIISQEGIEDFHSLFFLKVPFLQADDIGKIPNRSLLSSLSTNPGRSRMRKRKITFVVFVLRECEWRVERKGQQEREMILGRASSRLGTKGTDRLSHARSLGHCCP